MAYYEWKAGWGAVNNLLGGCKGCSDGGAINNLGGGGGGVGCSSMNNRAFLISSSDIFVYASPWFWEEVVTSLFMAIEVGVRYFISKTKYHWYTYGSTLLYFLF